MRKMLLVLVLLFGVVLADGAKSYGIYNPDWEIVEILDSKDPIAKKIERIKRVLKDPISPHTAKELLRFLRKEAPGKVDEIKSLIKIRSQALA
ncbi:MAG: hypothetical protein C6H99_01525 [Epsilonproteobacteria bacterium]|nr:hypothetical protein [Campylobacterota bacterium]NPA63915.1 hypothetical protein [Campylobacterota bacterium]